MPDGLLQHQCMAFSLETSRQQEDAISELSIYLCRRLKVACGGDDAVQVCSGGG